MAQHSHPRLPSPVFSYSGRALAWSGGWPRAQDWAGSSAFCFLQSWFGSPSQTSKGCTPYCSLPLPHGADLHLSGYGARPVMHTHLGACAVL